MSTTDGYVAPPDTHTATPLPEATPDRRRQLRLPAGMGSARVWSGWLFALPALVMYLMFVLRPLLASIQYSFYSWNGITVATPVGLQNYQRVFTDPELLGSIWHAFLLIIFFTVIPVTSALMIAALVQEVNIRGVGTGLDARAVPGGAADSPGAARACG